MVVVIVDVEDSTFRPLRTEPRILDLPCQNVKHIKRRAKTEIKGLTND